MYKLKSNIFIALLFALPYLSSSQDISLLVQFGDKYAESNNHLEAIKIYKQILEERDPNHRPTQYKIAESYRAILDYSMAKGYYQKVKRSGDGRFILSGYYYALMSKLDGEFSEALVEFENFMALLKSRDQHESPEYRQYYEQARIEREGCLIALNENTVAQPDHQFKLLPEPLNSKAMDSAPAIYLNDSTIAISSGRKGGKGSGTGALGEAWNDLYIYQKESDWDELKDNRKFDNLNSKTEDAAGFFNTEKNKFYFTRCEVASATSIDCFIYVSYLVDGTWSEPEKLNAYINQRGANSRQASVTVTGDSLFFCSDREGGFGRYDIYLSTKNGNENWGPPQNLGSQINTPFTESSPFLNHKEETLFFSSDGHRGFGGFDIYLAKGETFEKAEIYNMGAPFNSNKDDLFPYFGDHLGYLSSNRDGGVGKMDIYSFRIKSEKEIITEISTDESIAGRNSLFSDDYDFDSENDEKINEIISHLMASNVADVEMGLTHEQQSFYNSLSEDDKARIDRIVNARVRNLSQNDIQAIRVEDEFYYANLKSEDKRHVDNLVSAYVRESGLGLSVSVAQQEQNYYENLTVEERERVDMVIAQRVSQADNYSYPDIEYESLKENEQQSVDQLSYKLISEKKNLESLALAFDENLFLKTNENRKELIHSAIKEKVVNLAEDPKYELKEEDRIFYQNLDSKQLEAIKDIATALVMNDVNNFEANISQQDKNVYASFTSSQRQQLDRILAKIINNTVKADLYLGEANFTKNEVAVARLSSDIDQAFTQLRTVNPEYIASLPSSDHIKVKRFISVAEPWINSPTNIYLPSEPVSEPTSYVDRGPSVANVRENEITRQTINPSPSTSSPSTSARTETPLTTADYQFYESLSPDKISAVNRSIAAELINEDYHENSSLALSDADYFNALSSKEESYIEVLAKDLKGAVLTDSEMALKATAMSYFAHLSAEDTKPWSRLIAKEALADNRVGNTYNISQQDQETLASFSTLEKSNIQRITDFAVQNETIVNKDLNKINATDQGVITIIPNGVADEYREISISGYLLDMNTKVPHAAISVKLVSSNGVTLQKTETRNNGSFSFTSVPNSNYSIEVEGTVPSEKMYVDNLAIRGSGSTTDRADQISTDDVNLYENLSASRRGAIDRSIAAELLNEIYQNSPNKALTDEQFYNTLSQKEKSYISILAKELKGEIFSPSELSVQATAHSYYEHLLPNEQPIWSRLIATEVLDTYRAGDQFTISEEDQSVIEKLSYSEKNTYDRIKTARMLNRPILGDLSSEAGNPDLVKLPMVDGVLTSQVSVSGNINEIKTDLPISQLRMEMIGSNNQQLAETITAEDGSFDFEKVEPGDHTIIVSSKPSNAKFSQSIYASNLTITDEDGKIVLSPGSLKSKILQIEDVTFYENLNPETKEAINRAIAAELINKSYQINPELVSKDNLFYQQLSKRNKDFVEVLAKDLQGITLSASEVSLKESALDYIKSLEPEEVSIWTRLITREALKKNKNNNTFSISQEDRAIVDQLSNTQSKNHVNLLNTDTRIKQNLILGIGIDSNNLITEQDRAFYQGLTVRAKRAIDQSIAADLINRSYQVNPELVSKDNLFFDGLSKINKDFVEVLAKDLQGITLSATEISLKESALNHIKSLEPEEVSIWTRLITKEALEKNESNNTFSISQEDREIVDRLSNTQIKNYINLLSANPQIKQNLILGVGIDGSDLITENDEKFYQRLTVRVKRAIDQSIAAKILNSTYNINPELISSDEAHYSLLSQKEKDFIDVLSKELRGETLTQSEISLKNSAFSYLQHLPESEQPLWNRLITKIALKPHQQGNTIVIGHEEKSIIDGLSPAEVQIYNRIMAARSVGGTIITGSSLISPSRAILAEVPLTNASQNTQIQVSGKLSEIKTDVPAGNVSLKLTDKEGNVISRTSTNNNGGFKFDRAVNNAYSIQLDESSTSKYKQDSPNLYVSDMVIDQTDVTTILEPTYQEGLFALEGKDIAFYQNLERGEQKRIDRIIAFDYLVESYRQDPQLEKKDDLEYKNLNTRERNYIKILTKDLKGEVLTVAEQGLLSSAFTYYYNVAPTQKAIINRIVAKEIFKEYKQGNNYRISSSDASYRTRMSPEKQTLLNTLKSFRFNNNRILSENLAVESADTGDRKVVLNIPNYTNEEFGRLTITGKLINTKTGDPIAVKGLRVVDENETMIAKTFTGNDGSFHFNQIRAGNYHLELEHAYSAGTENENYFVKDLEVTGTKGMTHAYQRSFNIYFDFGASELRKEAEQALKEVAQLAKRQNIIIELQAHTDNIGNAEFNNKLSSERGQAAVNYLTGYGVDQSNITVLAYGKNNPVASNTDEYGRQFNRRAEVIIKSHQPINYLPPTVYLIRPKATLYSISKNFNLTVDEVMRLNGLSKPSIDAYKPIRIDNPQGIKPNLDMLVELNESVKTANNFKYTVKPGESIITIAEKFNLPEELLMEMNGLTSHELRNGQVLNIYVRY